MPLMYLRHRDRYLETDVWFPSLSLTHSVCDNVDPWDAYASKNKYQLSSEGQVEDFANHGGWFVRYIRKIY